MVEASRGASFRKLGDTAENDEFRQFAADRLIRFLNTSKHDFPGGEALPQVLESKERIRNFVLSLTSGTYEQLLTGINALVRNKSGKEEWKMDGEGVRMGDNDIFPAQNDKEELLAQSIYAAKRMYAGGRSTEDIALMLAVSLTAIHPFVNGNGRTAKFLLTVLMAGYDQKLIKDVLTSNYFSNAVNANFFQAKANEILDPEGKLVNEAYDTFMSKPESRRRIAELVIDMFLNENELEYRIGEKSTLAYFKDDLPSAVDPHLYSRVFGGTQ